MLKESAPHPMPRQVKRLLVLRGAAPQSYPVHCGVPQHTAACRHALLPSAAASAPETRPRAWSDWACTMRLTSQGADNWLWNEALKTYSSIMSVWQSAQIVPQSQRSLQRSSMASTRLGHSTRWLPELGHQSKLASCAALTRPAALALSVGRREEKWRTTWGGFSTPASAAACWGTRRRSSRRMLHTATATSARQIDQRTIPACPLLLS